MSELQSRLQDALGAAYRVERELGGGGMSHVFLAEEAQLARRVVVKVLPPELSVGVNAERFRREIQLAASLQHPHVVPLLAAGQSGELFWYTMPFIEGESLRVRIAREGELPVHDVTRLLRDVADALAYAHERGIVHRDIKPDNVLITGNHAVVTDFGVAKALSASTGQSSLTSVGVALGTPSYMAPEQASADPHTDHRADIYALGALAYEMLTGRPPFGGTPQAVLAAQVTQAPAPVGAHRATVPPALAAMVMRCLEKKPADRFQTARELLVQLEAMATPSGGMPPTGAVAAVPGATPGTAPGTATPAAATPPWQRTAGIAAALILVLGGLGAALLFGRKQPNVIASAARIAVIPFVPTTADTALARLGRDLVVTLSANLEGVGDIRMVDALTILAQAHERTISLADGAELARRLGASSFVHGSLVRLGSNVRLDLGLFTSEEGEPIARTSVTAPPDDLTALTDSTTWALLRQVWRAREAPTPNVAAVTTQSIPALRAFLEGEQAIAQSQWQTAADAFSRAIAADSTFWLAYWRYQYSRQWIFQPVDSAIVAAVRAHRAEFPERDRLLAEGQNRLVTQRFPEYWPGWMAYGDNLVHQGGYEGHLPAEAAAALDRVVELNPTFLPAWEHRFWVAAMDLDTAKVRELGTVLHRLGYNPTEYGFDAALLTRYWARLVLGGGRRPVPELADSAARDLAASRSTLVPFMLINLSAWGYNRAQADLNQRVLPRAGAGAVAEAALRSLAHAWAGRGGWDSALAYADRYAATGPAPEAPLQAYSMAVTGAWLGVLPLAESERRRPAAERAASAGAGRGELAWLDGLVAFLRSDRGGLAQARSAAAASSSGRADALAASLRGFEMALAGRRREAADTVLSVEARLGSQLAPAARGIARMAAARWLLAEGDTARAVRILRFPLSFSGNDAALMGNVLLAPHALIELARVARARGETDLARTHYRQFLIRYDLPPAEHLPWVEEARAALAR